MTQIPPKGEKLQKVLARAGIGSRRKVETWITEGRISVNGKTATIGDRVEETDRMTLNGRPLYLEPSKDQPCRVIAYNKPEGEVVSRSDPDGRTTIFQQLPKIKGSRWIAIGRLDINTSGLLLLTTDGDLAHRMMHPSHEIEREYAVRVLGEVKDEDIDKLKQGILLEDGMASFTKVVPAAGGEGANRWFYVELREGRNREVRRLWEALGLTVSRLKRIRYGAISLPRGVRSGKFSELTPKEIEGLRQDVGLTAPRPARDPAPKRQAEKSSPKPKGRQVQKKRVDRTRQKNTKRR